MKSVITEIRNRGSLLRGGLLAALACSAVLSPVRADYSDYNILHNFADVTATPPVPNDGGGPYGSLTLSADGTKFYGMTWTGGTTCRVSSWAPGPTPTGSRSPTTRWSALRHRRRAACRS